MVSLIVKSRTGEESLARAAERIDSIAHLDDPSTHPVKEARFRQEGLLKAARAEAALQGSRPRWLGIARVIFEMLAVRFMDRFGFKLRGIDFKKYKKSMTAHSDYRKYDEQLRMVIDCAPATSAAIRAYLEGERAAGTLFYGIHESKAALLTCFLQTMEDAGHIHFVDGGDGGYALAAKELKSQMRTESRAETPAAAGPPAGKAG